MAYPSTHFIVGIICVSALSACGVDDPTSDENLPGVVAASTGAGATAGAGGTGGAPMMSAGGGGAGMQVPTYSEVRIDFDELPSPTAVTDQYAEHLSFSSEPNIAVTAEGPYNIGQSLPNYLSAGSGNWVHNDLYVDFAAPVRKLAFKALGVGKVGPAAEVRVFEGDALAGTVEIIGEGNQLAPRTVDVSTWSAVTRIEIVNITDSNGIVYDDFTFEFPDPTP